MSADASTLVANALGNTTTAASEEAPLVTTSRYYRFVRSWTMTDPVHAKVELVTNSIDAVRRLRSSTLSSSSASAEENENTVCSIVELEEDLQQRTMVVRDFATGMSAEKMESAILVIGANTAEGEESRGTFSTGAKNVSQLGQVRWLSVKDGKFSSCYITLAGNGAMTDRDVPVTDEHRAALQLDEHGATSGTTVMLDYAPHVTTQRAERLMSRFLNYFAMRDILAGSETTVRARFRNPAPDHPSAAFVLAQGGAPAADSVHATLLPVPGGYPHDGEWSAWFDLRYQYPRAAALVDRVGYTVPEYPAATAYFEVYQSPTPLAVPEVYEEDTLQFGFTIASSRAVHEHSCFWPDLRTNEDMRYLYGRLRCDYIDTLLADYDARGPTAGNPVSIIDPGRLYGLNRSHPFVQWMLSVPTDRMRLRLRQMRDEFDAKNGIASDDVLNLVGQLESVGSALFDPQTVELEWRAVEQGTLLRAVRDAEEKFVFVRNAGVYELHSSVPPEIYYPQAQPTFVFSEDDVVRRIEGEAFPVDAQTGRPLQPVRINGRGDLVDPDDNDEEEENDVDDEEKMHALKPRLRVEVIYSDSDALQKRFRTTVVDDLLRITINTRSPCFMGRLRRNETTNEFEGLADVSEILVETLVQAFARMYVDRKIQSAAARNVVHVNNAAAAPEMKYAEELDEALILVERQIYKRIAVAISHGALEDDGAVTLDEVMSA